MKARVDVGTDVALIGAWDAQRNAAPFARPQLADHHRALEEDAAKGLLFLIRTGGDGGGPVDVYVEESVPAKARRRVKPIARNVLLSLPSGTLIVGGAEDYRAPQPRITDAGSAITVPAGDYALQCFVQKDPEQSSASEQELRKMVMPADIEYYDRINNRGCLGGALTLLLFPVLAVPLGWKIALGVTAAVFLSFFPILQWALKRNEKYQRLNAIIPGFRLKNADPTLVLELRRVDDPANLKGASVSL